MNGGMRPLTDEEVTAVSKSFTGKHAARNNALFILAVRTGYRITELLSMRVGDVLAHGKIKDFVTVRRANMKMKYEGRTMPLHAEATAALLAYITDTRPEMPLFPSQKAPSAPITGKQAWKVLQDAYDVVGLGSGIGTHAMRKTFGNRFWNRIGHDLMATASVLGPRDPKSTMHYLRVDQDKINEAILA